MGRMIASAPYVWLPFLLMAVLPAICEELAFRGFILSGLRHVGHKWWAIALSAVFFGIAHTVVQQSLAAAALGLVIGYVAVQTTSLVPGDPVPRQLQQHHVGARALAAADRRNSRNAGRSLVSLVVESAGGGLTYRMPVVIVAGLLSLGNSGLVPSPAVPGHARRRAQRRPRAAVAAIAGQ